MTGAGRTGAGRTGAGRTGPLRTAVAWCPDWSLTAAGADPGEPAVIIRGELVATCTPAARSEGVRVGQKRRDAQRACPGLRLFPDDPIRDGREFDRVITAVTDLVPRVEVIHPGLLAFPATGAARYHGGEEQLASLVTDAVTAAGGGECWFGIADGLFAAALASRDGTLVPAGRTPAFLGGQPLGVLGRPELTGLLRRLGLRTLGDFAALPRRDVLSRFGPDGAAAHRLARGLDERPVAPRRPDPELAVAAPLDPPVTTVEAAAFALRPLAQLLHQRLSERGLLCTLLGIEAHTTTGESSTRLWRHGSWSAAAVVERLRWQLEGWLTAGGGGEITLLRLVPEELAPGTGEQLDLFGGDRDAADRMARAVARVQGLLGPEAAVVAVPSGGRSPGDRLTWVPWDEPRHPRYPVDRPWPGGVPPPYPALVHPDPLPARLRDTGGAELVVTGRGALSGAPARLAVGAGADVPVTGWGGPWPVEERWWDPHRHRRLAWLQVTTADGRAYLLARRDGQWRVEAEYD